MGGLKCSVCNDAAGTIPKCPLTGGVCLGEVADKINVHLQLMQSCKSPFDTNPI